MKCGVVTSTPAVGAVITTPTRQLAVDSVVCGAVALQEQETTADDYSSDSLSSDHRAETSGWVTPTRHRKTARRAARAAGAVIWQATRAALPPAPAVRCAVPAPKLPLSAPARSRGDVSRNSDVARNGGRVDVDAGRS